jgi:hypothetical protein
VPLNTTGSKMEIPSNKEKIPYFTINKICLDMETP